MRAKLPVQEGTVERDGVKLHYHGASFTPACTRGKFPISPNGFAV